MHNQESAFFRKEWDSVRVDGDRIAEWHHGPHGLEVRPGPPGNGRIFEQSRASGRRAVGLMGKSHFVAIFLGKK